MIDLEKLYTQQSVIDTERREIEKSRQRKKWRVLEVLEKISPLKDVFPKPIECSRKEFYPRNHWWQKKQYRLEDFYRCPECNLPLDELWCIEAPQHYHLLTCSCGYEWAEEYYEDYV